MLTSLRRGTVALLLAVASLFGLGCSSTERSVVAPVAKPAPKYLLVFDRPQPKGTWARVRGQFERYANVKARYLGWVLSNASDQFHAEYDAEQTWQELAVDGRPRALRFDMLDLRVWLGEPPSKHSLGRGRVARLRQVEEGQVTRSAGQTFTLTAGEREPQLDLLSGSLSNTERTLLLTPQWLAGELTKETIAALIFGTASPQPIGATWRGDRDLAQAYLAATGVDFAPNQIRVEAKLERIDQVGPLDCYFVSGKLHAAGGKLRGTPPPQIEPIATKVDIEYSAALPTRLEWPAVVEERKLTAVTTVRRKLETGSVYGTLDLQVSNRREVTAVRYP